MAQYSLGQYQTAIETTAQNVTANNIIQRIWDMDHTVWADDPEEIMNRLDWLTSATELKDKLSDIQAMVTSVQADGYTDVLLLGMGGSSLAPEVFSRTFGAAEGFLSLEIVDSTDPHAILYHHNRLDLSKTLFIVATKSGGTAETLSAFKYFYNQTAELVGADAAGAHFVAITDPGSKLVTLAEKFHFRATFLNNPNIGGRYSVLSHFGIVPASLLGINVETLLDRAVTMANACRNTTVSENDGAYIGIIIGELANQGRDKLTFLSSPAIESFGDWVEQLIAESTGKVGKGILPVVTEPSLEIENYGDDRVFVHLRLDDTHDVSIKALKDAGHPVIELAITDSYDLGGQFFLWEFATAIAGHVMGIHPFNQPNVEAAKISARAMITEYQEKGQLPQTDPILITEGVQVYGDIQAGSLSEVFDQFLAMAGDNSYIALQAYLPPSPHVTEALTALREALLVRTHLATTQGFGPRFLHSTGQLHKGDAGNGLFIQFSCNPHKDVAIPDEAGKAGSSMSFDVLKMSQTLGDGQALQNATPARPVIRFHLGEDVANTLQKIIAAV